MDQKAYVIENYGIHGRHLRLKGLQKLLLSLLSGNYENSCDFTIVYQT